ncbi:Detected protein of confused Function [Hibiscus syriacus]|uniref:Detected protein of confused Function n=1 Tax=Hibiscus syriacus TaxID=106335 RepID=A0A6A3BGN6_HIBSY|nr:geraniol 8-hydroxylase-like [Hibiscus syriacus]KAE8715041.1 Detected protein of confused Function [Hibiscus syriacus]
MTIISTSPYSNISHSKIWSWFGMDTRRTDDFARLFFTFVGVFVIFRYSLMCIKSKNRNPKSAPGPRGLPIVGSLPFLEPDLHSFFAQLARTYGPVVKLRLGSKIGILISSPSTAREVLKDQDITFANRDVPVVGLLATGGRDIVWSPNGPQWRMLRKVCVLKMLNNATLDKMYMLRCREVRKTVDYIYGNAGAPVNLGEQMFQTILNVVTNMLWGSTLEGNAGANAGAEFKQVMSEITEILGLPNISDFFPVLAPLDLQGLCKRIAKPLEKLNRIIDNMIDQRLKVEKKSENSLGEVNDFLQILIQLKDENDSKTPLTMDHIKALLLDMVVGGTDTSSNSIEFTLAEVINNPEVMKKAQKELDEVVGKDNIVEESHIHKLPYLLAIMKESLRLHPVLPLLVPHCPGEACTVGDYTIPKGCRVFINAWAIHRDPCIWENPLEFNPDRFLNSRLDFSGNDFSYFPFGSGRRMCAGVAMAERMVLYLVATVLHSFDWKVAEEEKFDLSEKFGIVLKLKNPLVAIPLPRLSNPALYRLKL